MEPVKIDKLVHGGQGMGILADGRKVFAWNALPGETVLVRLVKKRRDYAEGIAEEVLESSAERIEPRDEAYLSTSPWQIMTFEAENSYKQQILEEAFDREDVKLPKVTFKAPKSEWHYRNKMEYSFWADEDGLHLALFHRASHGKRIISGSSIARPEIDEIANKVCSVLNQNGIRGSQLKTVIVRCNQNGEIVAALFVKDQDFPDLTELDGLAKGLVVYYSNPKSPASIISKQLHKYGDITLTDTIAGKPITYDVNSFFQVNLLIFSEALAGITKVVAKQKNIIDMYAGVGTIGLSVGATTLVDIDEHNIAMAKQNAANQKVTVLRTSTENALDHITPGCALIVDPPRAGLHKSVVDRILEVKPKTIAYLSCNPSTQARDLAALKGIYKIKSLTGYNFFPRTPHIESLAVLELNHV
jgi:23S rRNA (uracil1939-C5)-methyltransferase